MSTPDHPPAFVPRLRSGVSRMLTMAQTLAAYRDELIDLSFTREETQALVLEAARTCRTPWTFLEAQQ